MFKIAASILGNVFPRKPEVTIVEERRDEQIAQLEAAYRIVRNGRSVNMALGEDGHWHFRRRAKQIRRDFEQGVSWRAMPHVEDVEPVRKWKYPWWWI